MRKITVLEFVSLDGVMQAPGGSDEDTSGGFAHGGWVMPYFDEFAGGLMAKQMTLENSSLLLGRKTYDIFANYWPQNAGDWPGINEAAKYVVSQNSAFDPTWENSVLLTGDVVQTVTALKMSKGPDLQVWGSGVLVQTLLKNGLIDEIKLKTFPIVLGSGKRLFALETMPSSFVLTESVVSPKGIIFANYAREDHQ